MSYRESLDTPALVVFEDVLDANLQQMADYAASQGINLRPHFKTHKTAEVARMQLARGAVGITCAKLGEAEALVDSGAANNIYIANQIVGPLKTARLVKLMEKATVRVAVDSYEVARGLNEAMAEAGKTIDVIIEVNTGQSRAGILVGEVVPLAKRIRDELPNVRVAGVMTHEGHAGAADGPEQLRQLAEDAGRKTVETARLLREEGFEIDTVSVGSTPAAFVTTKTEGITEMRPGTYVFQDNTIFRMGEHGPENCALRILATVTSRPAPDRAILDTGSKVLTSDLSKWKPGFGHIVEYPEAVIENLSEEHGWVRLPASLQDGMQIGEKVEIIPNHVCPTVNLADELFLVRAGEVVEVWPVIARGKSR
jgi:D-serine deaminase-like pyridoxal phosphate-dependent protein